MNNIYDMAFLALIGAGGALMYYLVHRKLARQAKADGQPGTLLIDDMRNMDVERTARTYDAGIAALKARRWDVLYLDHDLGDFSGPSGRERTGYDVMCWLEANTDHLPGRIVIVSANSVGRQRMTQVIDKLYGTVRR